MPPFRLNHLLPLALLAIALTLTALACTSDDPTATPTPSPSPTSEATQSPTASPTPTPTTTPVPDVRNATVLLPGLRVRTAPDGPDLGRLPESERIIVVGRHTTSEDPQSVWLGVQYLGWVHYSPDNIKLDRGVDALPLIAHPDLRLSTQLRANEPRTGIPAIDRVIEAVLRVDIDTLASLVQTHQQPCSDAPGFTASPTCPEGVRTGTPVAAFDIGTCGDQSQLADQLPSYLASLLHRHSTGDELPPLHLNAALEFDRDAGGYWTFFSPSPNNVVAIGLLITEDGAISSIGSGCGDPASSPIPTHLPTLNSYLPSPLTPPLTITAPPPTDTPEVDAVFAAFASGDSDALVAMVSLSEAECTTDARPGYDARCADLGLNPGDTYQGIPVGSCDLSLLSAEAIPEFFAGLVGSDATRTTPFGAYLVSEQWWSGRGGVVVIFVDPADEPIRQLWSIYLSNGRIVSVFSACGTSMPEGASVDRWHVYPADLGYDLRQLPPTLAYDSPRLHRAFDDAGLGTIGLREPLTLPWLTAHGLPLAGYRLPVGDSASIALFDLPDLKTTAELRSLVLGQLPEPLLPGARAIWTTNRTLVILWNRIPHWDIEDVLIDEFGQPLLLEENQDPAGARPSEGSPFSGKDLVLALRTRGISTAPGHTGVGLCGKEQRCGTGISYGTFLLWTYETTEARAAEWDIAPDGRATALIGTPPGEPAYGNSNLVLVLATDDEETARLIIDTLLSLTP